MAFLKSKSLTQSEFYLVFIPSLVFEVMASFIFFNSTSKYLNRPTRLSTVFPSPKHLSPNSLFTNLKVQKDLQVQYFAAKINRHKKLKIGNCFFFFLKILHTGPS